MFLFKQLHLTLTYTHFLSVYTVLTCSGFIWLMKCSSLNCSWHYVYTASHSIHSINLKYVHLAHEFSHLKGKLVLNVPVLNSFDLKLFSFHSTLIELPKSFHFNLNTMSSSSFERCIQIWLCDIHICLKNLTQLHISFD